MVLKRPFSRGAFILVTLVTGLALLLGPLQPALAQSPNLPVPVLAASFPVSITANAPEAANQTYKNIYSELTRAGVLALTNAAQLFLGQMAYDTAEYIATGGKGQGKLFFEGKVGEYLSNVGGDAAGEFMAGLSDSSFFRGIGFNVCQPRDPTTLLRLQVSLGDLGRDLFPDPSAALNGAAGQASSAIGGLATSQYNRPRPRCDFQTVLDNYDTLYRTMSDGDVISNLEQSFDPGTSQLGSLTNVYNRFLTDTQRQVTNAAAQRQEGNGFRPLEGIISGSVRTPASVIQEATNEQVVRKPGTDQSQAVQNILSNAWDAGPIQLAIYTGSIFLNTLASKFLQRIFQEGLGGSFTPSAAIDFSGPDSVAIYGKTDARNANIDLKDPPAQQTADYDVVSQMQTCLPAQRGTWNCVLDQSLVQAVRSKTSQGGVTVREALERGFLHKEWRLIPETRLKENQDPQCYTQAYCAGNLQKMRLMRILPIGFEFAANSPVNQRRCDSAEGCITLDEVAKNFSNCNADGQLDDAHPWCHLIDPNWVVTSFSQQCTLKGYTDTLVSSKLPIRKEECQDIQTCLSRNDKGECVGGYGYCLSERPVYRFAADVCPAQAASCRIYTDSANQTVGYLRNTIDRAACDASNAGCLWYSTTRELGTPTSTAWTANTSTGDRVYFKAASAGQTSATKGFDSCPAGDEGCTRLYPYTPGKATLNLVINGSFEGSDPTTSTDALAWRSDNSVTSVPTVFGSAPALPSSALVDTAYLGSKARRLSAGSAGNLLQSMAVVGGRSYAFSFYARSDAGAASLTFELYPSTSSTAVGSAIGFTGAELDRLYHSTLTVGPRSVSGGFLTKTLNAELSQAWQRFDYTFVVPSSTQGLHLFMRGSQALVDGLQLEEGEYATPFVETFTSGLSAVFMKVAPDELQCTKPLTDTTRSPLCNAFAQTCNQQDAGCQGYTDKDGGQEVPAILSENDLCPAMCVGYAEYRKAPSSFDLVQDVDPRFSDPVESTSTYFIPRTAGQCTQQDVGCESFTVLDDAGTTDGSTANFNYIRACEKPGADSETYFTWEGADTVGYQLRTWSLKRDTSELNLGPRAIVKMQADQISFKEPATCNEASWRTAADPDCRQFYDASGRIYYRYFSQTILSSAECTNLRLTGSSQADCERTGGRFNERNECTYGAFLPESRTCSAQATSCRMYTGANSGNTQTVLTQSFRDTIAPFDTDGVTQSAEALLVGDKSLRVGAPRGVSVARARAGFASQETFLYRATFWAKVPATSTTVTVRTSAPDGSGEAVIGAVRLTPDWQRFTVGLFEGAPNASTTLLSFSGPLLIGADYGFYLDEVSVVRVQDVVYVRKNTWTTPAQCDQGTDGAPEAQAMLNCKAYANRANQTVNARRFTRLCRETAIGCTAFVDTRNTDESYGRTIVQPNPVDPLRYPVSRVQLKADRNLYLIDDPTKRCSSQNMSCTAFGKPNLSPDRQTLDPEKPYETVYFKNDVTRYGSALCKPSEAFCAEYKFGTAKEYFRDPGNSVCEYRKEEIISGDTGVSETHLAGWYVKGSANTACYPTILEGGNSYGLARSGDATYKGYVGLCERAAGECTELRDISNVSNSGAQGAKSYYYIKNDRLDTSSCNGTADPGTGCVLFRDMSSGALNYNAQATYDRYKSQGYKPVTPVDCRNNPDNPFCRQANFCNVQERIYAPGPGGSGLLVSSVDTLTTTQCTADTDCASLNASGSIAGTPRFFQRSGTCKIIPPEQRNDSNILLKVSVDRECSQWLGCRSSETVLDPATGQYREICSSTALCDKATGQNNDPFCANYVDRRTTSTEPILAQGSVLDAKLYASRSLGLGQKDYSGYAIPNAFQAMDLESVRVAVDGAKNVSDAQFRLSQDYRLTAAVPMPPTLARTTGPYEHRVPPTKNQARILGALNSTSSADGLLVTNPGLSLCQHIGSGRIGYFVPVEVVPGKSANCYLPVHSNSDLLDFQNMAEKFALADPKANAFLSQAFPPAECRAQPEQDSPFPASFTTEWDTTRNPAKPVRRLSGFAAANTCEFGEDCSCTYKRVDYENNPISKFYNQYSSVTPPGICVGGPRDGQGCIPGKIFNSGALARDSAGTSGGLTNAILDANAEQLCGPPDMGGQCMPAKAYTVVQGVFGNCLERDTARTIGSSIAPCLTWNPNALLKGEKDPYHYSREAGYMPPQNSGQYYCLSNARKPISLDMSKDFFDGSDSVPYTGSIKKLTYDDAYVSDDSDVASSGQEEGSRIDGGLPSGSNVSHQCEATDDDQDAGGDFQYDTKALRIVNTGRNKNRQYTESFFKIVPSPFARGYWGRSEADETKVLYSISDTVIGYLGFTAIRTPNETARLSCGYNQDWVDNLSAPDYENIASVRGTDVSWQNQFNTDFKGVLTRSSEQIVSSEPASSVTDPSTLTAFVGPCVDTVTSFQSKRCFFKTWQTDYRTEEGDGKRKFVALSARSDEDGTINDGTTAVSDFQTLRTTPFYGKCESGKPYFSIRAVFQTKITDADGGRTAIPRTEIESRSANWSLAGYWVAACGGSESTDEHYIYMYPRVEYGDVCTELAEVVSKDSKQDAAFTDRVWKDGNFTIPVLGISYNARYAPFSSALNTRTPGVDPLFQTGQEIAGYSPLNAPTFLAAGYRTYYTSDQNVNDKWAYLTNVFARVYRIYRYYDTAVNNGDFACMAGSNKGKKCVAGTDGTSPDCSSNGICSHARLVASGTTNFGSARCNALSGINAGITCLSGDQAQACHEAPIQLGENNAQVRRLLPCVTQPFWTKRASDGKWLYVDGSEVTQEVAAQRGAFRCPNSPASLRRAYVEGSSDWKADGGLAWGGSILGSTCSAPTDQDGSQMTGSVECPERIYNNLEVAPAAGVPLADLRSVAAAGSTRRMTAVCEGASGARPGRCRINVPAYTLTAANGHTLTMNEFVVDPNSGYKYGSCWSNEDCSFTNNNFYLQNPPPSLPNESYGSSRSITAASVDPDTMTDSSDYLAIACSDTDSNSENDWAHPPTGAVAPTPGQCRGLVEAGEGSNHMYIRNASGQPSLAARETPQRLALYGLGTAVGVGRDYSGWIGLDYHSSIKKTYSTYLVGACVVPETESARVATLGMCNGGRNDGTLCNVGDNSVCAPIPAVQNRADSICQAVSTRPVGSTVYVPNAACQMPNAVPRQAGDTGVNLNNDDNICTHERGYVPRPDICPNPNDEFCGLIAYNVRKADTSVNPRPSTGAPRALLPTDVTLGLHDLSYLLNTPGASDGYSATYIPRPPTIAAPDITSCPSPGKCAVQALNKLSLNGSTEGNVTAVSAQAKGTLRFYAWASHEQMPLRSLMIDWGDGGTEKIDDAKIKNHKPFCGVRKECVTVSRSTSLPNEKISSTGLTCNTNNDCPVGAGTCQSIGTCREKPSVMCSSDSQCRNSDQDKDTCQIRTLFGNSGEACEENFFEFNHLYTCNGPDSLPSCSTAGYGVAPGANTVSTLLPPPDIAVGACYFGTRDAEVLSVVPGRPRPTLGLTECITRYNSALGLAGSERATTVNAPTLGIVLVSASTPRATAPAATPSTTVYRCERDPNRRCSLTNSSSCAPGDRCIANMAPAGGCWDDQVQVCRFTPKVMIQDNWGWCNGECRTTTDSGGAPADNRAGTTPTALHPYGGCYAATPQGSSQTIRDNTSGAIRSEFINECNPGLPSSESQLRRPWTVYQGSITLRSDR